MQTNAENKYETQNTKPGFEFDTLFGLSVVGLTIRELWEGALACTRRGVHVGDWDLAKIPASYKYET